jgi:5-methylcytosine-specific restriction endonuclease McrA
VTGGVGERIPTRNRRGRARRARLEELATSDDPETRDAAQESARVTVELLATVTRRLRGNKSLSDALKTRAESAEDPLALLREVVSEYPRLVVAYDNYWRDDTDGPRPELEPLGATLVSLEGIQNERFRADVQELARGYVRMLAWRAPECGKPSLEDELEARAESAEDPVALLREVMTQYPWLVAAHDESHGVTPVPIPPRSQHTKKTERPMSRRRRQGIPERTRHEVWRRDEGRCVDCGSRERLEFDHIIPVSQGGSNTARNIELRCESCNRGKAAKI